MVRATFFMEQHIGHQAYYQNLRRFIDQAPEIESSWVEVTYQNKHSRWQRLPLLPRRIRGPLVGRSQVREGMRAPADVLFFNTQVPAVLSGRRRSERPYLIATDITPLQYDRMAEWYRHRPDRDSLVGKTKRLLTTRVLRNASRLLPWSSWAGRSLIDDYGVQPEKIEVFPPGVDLDIWSPPRKSESQLLRILFVGGDFLRKGGQVLLKAYQHLTARSRIRNVELVLVTQSQVPAIPGIQVYSDFEPNSPELIRLYQSSDLFVLPSFAEPFGIAAVEASAAGLPVIATKTGGLQDIVENNVTGFLIEPGNSESLVEKLQLFLENKALRTQMGQAARQRAELLFDACNNSSRLLQIIHEVI